MSLSQNKPVKIYFISDLHLGAPNFQESLVREKLFVNWLNIVQEDATEIYLMGDLFDFWFEYKHTAPKYFVRALGKLAEIADKGIPIHCFSGNHDMWMFSYLEKEIGMKIYHQPIEKTLGKHLFYLGHGDGLGPGDFGYKFIKKIFRNKACQWLFARLHPNFAFGLANYWSGKSRLHNNDAKSFLGDKEFLYQFGKEKIKENPAINYFVFGHRHLPIDVIISENCRYLNLGDWIQYFTYAQYDGNNLELKYFKTD